MFFFNADPVISRQQEIDDNKTQTLIEKYVNIEHSQKIEDFFDNHCNSISYLVDFVHIIRDNGFKIIVPLIPRDEKSTTVNMQIMNGFKITSKYSYDYIPFIKFTFMEEQNLNGYVLQEMYMLFFNKHSNFKDSEAATLYYLNRFNKMKAFI